MAPQQSELLADSDSDGVEERSTSVLQLRRIPSILMLAGLLAVGLLIGAVSWTGSHSAVVTGGDGIVDLAASASSGKPSTLRQHHLREDKTDNDADKCSWGQQNCNATKCCNNPGTLCYQQTTWYAQCRTACVKGSPDPLHWDEKPWSCKELGERSEGDSSCAEIGQDCRKAGCCSMVNTQCFEKNDDWATCKSECIEDAPDLADQNGDPWKCTKLGPWTQGASPWVAEKCSQAGEDCTSTACCASPGAQCYKQSDFWAQCKYECAPGKDPARDWEPEWICDEVGVRTPGTDGMPAQQVGEWVLDTCADYGDDCTDSKCCLTTNHQCYAKNDNWAMCMDTCTQGRHADDKNETWSCNILGPRSLNGLAIKGTPSLFCWSLFQTTTYENDIMKKQVEDGVGIFECDEATLLSTADITDMGKGPDGKNVKTLKVAMAEITTSVDGTAGNAQLFINCWNAVIEEGRWRHHAWIIKVDPDAVILPQRVRDHLRSHVLENVYVVNCNKFPSSANFPMMYGSVEIFSYLAIDTYARNMGLCMTDMGMMIPQWGEDYFMTHCLDHVGVGRISDFASVGDNVCTGGSCSDQYFSAFHPFKTVDAWQECLDMANGKIAPPPAPEWG